MRNTKANSSGFAHHFIIPVLAIFAVGAIGVLTLNLSSAATLCKSKTYSINSKSECVRDAQYMLGVAHDAEFGPNTQKALIKKTGQSKLNSTAWKKLCAGNYSATVNKYRDNACKGKKVSNPTVGYKVCKKYSYTAPKRSGNAPYSLLSKPTVRCTGTVTYKGVGSESKAKAATKTYRNESKAYQVFLSDKRNWDDEHPKSKAVIPTYPRRIAL